MEKLLQKHYKKVTGGRPPGLPGVVDVQDMMMQRWYNLSDAGMSGAMREV